MKKISKIYTFKTHLCCNLSIFEAYGKPNVVIGWLYGVQRHLQQYFGYIVNGQLYWWRKPEDHEKTTDLLPVTDTLYQIMLYTSPSEEVKPTTSVVVGTDCISSCKSNHHTTTTTTTPLSVVYNNLLFNHISKMVDRGCLRFFFSDIQFL